MFSFELFAGSMPVKKCLPRVDDCGVSWWRDASDSGDVDSERYRYIRTGYYQFVFDAKSMSIAHLKVDKSASGYTSMARGAGRIVRSAPADLELNIIARGKKYAVKNINFSKLKCRGVREIESGRYVQRFDVPDLFFFSKKGKKVDIMGRLEVTAWPDSLGFHFYAKQCSPENPEGVCAGKVKNGFCFTGDNVRIVRHKKEYESEKFSLETWIFLPKQLSKDMRNCWIVNKNGYSWEQGHFGFNYNRGFVSASMNIGGGRKGVNQIKYKNRLEFEKWYHLVMTYDNRSLKFYVNGALVDELMISKRRNLAKKAIYFAQRADGRGEKFIGIIDETRLYSIAMTEEAVANHYKNVEKVVDDDFVLGSWNYDNLVTVAKPGEDWLNAQLEIKVNYNGKQLRAISKELKVENPNDIVMRKVDLNINPMTASRVLCSPLEVSLANKVDNSLYQAINPGKVNAFLFNISKAKYLGEGQNRMEIFKLHVNNPSANEETAKLVFFKENYKSNFTGITMLVRDLQGNPLPAQVQISKNTNAVGKDDIHKGTWVHGTMLLHLPAGVSTDLELVVCYERWGHLPAVSYAQDGMVGLGYNQHRDQVSVGSWGESLDFDWSCCDNKAILTDIRPLMVSNLGTVAGMPKSKWGWTENVGGGDFLFYYNEKGKREVLTNLRAVYKAHGPNLSKVTYLGNSADNKINASITISVPRTDDYLRVFQKIRYDVVKPVSFSRLAFYQMGADSINNCDVNNFAIGNHEDMIREWSIYSKDKEGGKYIKRNQPTTGKDVWFSLHNTSNKKYTKGGFASRGLIVRSWKGRIAGKEITAPSYSLYSVIPSVIVELSPPAGVYNLQPGDYLEAEIELIVIPCTSKDYYGSDSEFKEYLKFAADTWRPTFREASKNRLELSVTGGTVIKNYPLVIAVDNNKKRDIKFSIKDGVGYIPITFTGLTDYKDYTLYKVIGSIEKPIAQATHGKDFWQTEYDATTNSYTITYNVKLNERKKRAKKYSFILRNNKQ